MKEKLTSIRDKIKEYVTNNKKQTYIIGGIVAAVLCVAIGLIVQLNSSEVIASAKSRNAVLEGETVTNIAYNSLKESEKGPSKSYGKVLYLTIDDGPSAYTDKIIKILNKNNAHATFFMINANMQVYPEQVKHIVESGNTGGFHSVSHDIHKLYASSKSAKEEFDINQKTFEKITGQTSKIIRLPFGSKPYTPKASYDELVNAGYKLWDWTLDTEDWRSTSPQIIKNVKKYSQNADNVVLLIHERQQTVAVLDEMLKYLKSQGFEIVAIKQSEVEKNYWNGKLYSQN